MLPPAPQSTCTTRRLWLQTAGQDLVEYALLAGFLAVAGGATLYLAGDRIKEILKKLRERTRRRG